jgi:hypothetical protein
VVPALIAIAALVLTPAAGARIKTRTFSSGNLIQLFGSFQPYHQTTARITIPRANQGRIKDIDVAVRLNHPVDGEVRLVLQHPLANGITLSDGVGGDGANYGTGATKCSGTSTVFDDEAATPITAGTPPFASSFQPQTPLSTFDGNKTRGPGSDTPGVGRGLWGLSAVDQDYFNANKGAVYCFTLTITYKPL